METERERERVSQVYNIVCKDLEYELNKFKSRGVGKYERKMYMTSFLLNLMISNNRKIHWMNGIEERMYICESI